MSFYQYKNSHCKERTILRPSYLYNGNLSAWKKIFLLKRVHVFDKVQHILAFVPQWKMFAINGCWITLLCEHTVYPKKYAHGFCFAVLCCGYTLTDFPISIRLTSLALWQSNDCPSASKATLMNMDKYFMWIHFERLHNHNKAKHNKTVCIFLGIYCMLVTVCTLWYLTWINVRYGIFEKYFVLGFLTHLGRVTHVCVSKRGQHWVR